MRTCLEERWPKSSSRRARRSRQNRGNVSRAPPCRRVITVTNCFVSLRANRLHGDGNAGISSHDCARDCLVREVRCPALGGSLPSIALEARMNAFGRRAARAALYLTLFGILHCSSTAPMPEEVSRVEAPLGAVTFESLGTPSGIALHGSAACSWGPNRFDVFATGSNNALWHKWYDGTWHPWESLGGNLASGPAAVSWGPGRIDIVAVDGPTHRIAHLWYDSGWGFWETRGSSAVATASPGISSYAPGRL